MNALENGEAKREIQLAILVLAYGKRKEIGDVAIRTIANHLLTTVNSYESRLALMTKNDAEIGRHVGAKPGESTFDAVVRAFDARRAEIDKIGYRLETVMHEHAAIRERVSAAPGETLFDAVVRVLASDRASDRV